MSTYVLTGGIRQGSAERLVVAATMAPAIHGVQAWRFRVLPGRIEVQADPARFRTMTDPHGRSVHVSCGAALLNLRLAAAQLGREPVVRLLPDRTRPSLLASVRLAGPHRTSPFERRLYAATMRPTPARRPYGDQPPPQPVLNELAEAARLEAAHLHPAAVNGALAHVLTTQGDGPAEWLRAGQALQRVLLTSASHAISASYRYELTALPEPRDVRVESGEVPQALIQLGRPALY